jgi:hypothetical protein
LFLLAIDETAVHIYSDIRSTFPKDKSEEFQRNWPPNKRETNREAAITSTFENPSEEIRC